MKIISYYVITLFILFTGCQSKDSEDTSINNSKNSNESTAQDTSKTGEIEYLLVQNSKDVKITPTSLTLIGVSPTTIMFSDRPERITGHIYTEDVLTIWEEGKDKLSVDPPNATLSIFGEKEITDIVMELKNPKMVGDNFIYDINILDGNIPDYTGYASLFIDPVGMPRSPVSVGGVARRTTRRAVLR
ncbi:MAG: hypothetical protein WAT71_09445 [Ignavibacteria bacterium]